MPIKSLPIILGIIIVALLGVLIFVPSNKFRNEAVPPNGNATSTGNATSSEDRNDGADQVTYYSYASAKGKTVKASVAANQEIDISPAFIWSGNVPAGWAFEANFPVTAVDANGKIVATGHATVPNWMSDNGAWYSATIAQTAAPGTATGFIVISRDNASGLPENEDEVRIPVRFR